MTTDNSTAPAQGLTDEQIDALNRSAQDAAISTGIPPHRALVRAALAAAPQPVPVANSRPLSELIARDEAIPERAAALEKARAAAAPHTATPVVQPVVPARYRLLQRTDLIEPTDEFLADDGETWAVDPLGVFVGTNYAPAVLRPGRRPLRAAPASDADSMPAQPTKEV